MKRFAIAIAVFAVLAVAPAAIASGMLSGRYETKITPGLVSSGMRRILLTGMSGTGKSSALAELKRLGFEVVDTDAPAWTEWSYRDGGYVWREDRIEELLSREVGPALYVCGTVSNQGRFYDRFDAVVLLSAPVEVLISRVESRTTNPYGKTPDQRQLIIRHLAEVEPLLRQTCTHEIDATQPLANVVQQLIELGNDSPASVDAAGARGKGNAG